MTSTDFHQRIESMATFGELLRIAGSAAANFESAHHRAIACRELDKLGSQWQAHIAGAKAELGSAILATVHALAAAPSLDDRALIGEALRALVKAGRRPLPAVRQSAPLVGAVRRYWVEQ